MAGSPPVKQNRENAKEEEEDEMEDIFGGDSDDDDKALSDVPSDFEEDLIETKPQQPDSDDEPALPSFRKNKGEGTSTRRKKKEKSKKRSRPEDDEDQVPLTDAQARVQEDLGKFDQLIDSFKPTRKVYAEEDVGDKSFQLRADMIQAAEEDTENVNNKRIAAAKFKMLPRVQEELSKPIHHEIYLDNGILEAMRLWLEPFDDGSLTSTPVRHALYEIMQGMDIDSDHLRESKIGHVVYFLHMTEKESDKMRKKWGDLINTWVRPVTNKSANYRDMQVEQIEVRSSQPRLSQPYRAPPQVEAPIDTDGPRIRAVIPRPDNQAFTKRPKSDVNLEDLREQRRAQNPSSVSRMKANMVRMKAKIKSKG